MSTEGPQQVKPLHTSEDLRFENVRKSRIVVIETVHHQFTGPAVSVESRYSRWLETTEQPFERRLTLGEEWVPLPIGWLEESGVSMLCIQNKEGAFPGVNPTKEEKAKLLARVIEIGTKDSPRPHWLVPPGESIRVMPADPKELLIRCRPGTGSAACIITVFPR